MAKLNKTRKSNKSKETTAFIGEYFYALDDKGRVAMPPKFRDAFAGGCVVTKGVDSCLYVFAPAEWEKLAEQIAALPMTVGNNRAYGRMMLGGAMDVELDKQSRVMVPEYLRQYAGLGHDVVLVGLYRRLELWDLKAWQAYKAKMEADSEAIAESVATFDF